MQSSVGRETAIAGITRAPIARHRADDAVGVHLADALVVLIHNENIANTVHFHAQRGVQRGTGCRPAIAGVARAPIAHHRADEGREVGSVQLPLVGEWPGAGHGHAERCRAAVGHHLVRRLLGDVIAHRQGGAAAHTVGSGGDGRHTGRYSRGHAVRVNRGHGRITAVPEQAGRRERFHVGDGRVLVAAARQINGAIDGLRLGKEMSEECGRSGGPDTRKRIIHLH